MSRRDPLLTAFDELEEVIKANQERNEQMLERIARVRADRRAGRSLREIVESEDGPLVVTLVSHNAQALDRVGARVRRIEARLLHEDGLTMDEIAVRFGVTRQRISAVLREAG